MADLLTGSAYEGKGMTTSANQTNPNRRPSRPAITPTASVIRLLAGSRSLTVMTAAIANAKASNRAAEQQGGCISKRRPARLYELIRPLAYHPEHPTSGYQQRHNGKGDRHCCPPHIAWTALSHSAREARSRELSGRS